MGRVVNTDSTAKRRNQERRTIAELLRRLSQKQGVDEDVKDMVAAIIRSLNAIDDGIESSAAAWEKRDYWMKAEGLRREWAWVSLLADEFTNMIREENWDDLPNMLIKLLPRFADIQVKKFTRTPDDWEGAYDELQKAIDSR